MPIHFEEQFRHFVRQQGIRHDYVPNLKAVLTYTSMQDISPLSINKFTNLEDIKQQIVTNRIKAEPTSNPEGYANNCISALRKYMQFINQKSASQHVWVMALGANAFNFERDYEEGTISIGWEELGNLKQYASKEDIEKRMLTLWPEGSESRRNDRLACYEFANRMQVGDLVFIRHSRKDIIGYGYISGDYQFDSDRKLHNHVRKFNWVSKGNWQIKQGMHHSKTLTEISDEYPETVLQFKELVGLNEISTIYPDTLPEQTTYEEGSRLTTIVNAYERNPEARQKCIDHYKAICQVCDFDFEKIYGAIGSGFIHVHHLTELRDIGKSYQVNPLTDLAPVCPNCHAILHKRRPAYSIDELKAIISQTRTTAKN